jgi:hypothetical protein
MASSDSRSPVARALFEAKAQPAEGRSAVWPQLLGPNKPDIIQLDPGGPEPEWPPLRDPNDGAGPDPQMLAEKLAGMDAELAAMRKAHPNPPAKRKPAPHR